MSSSSATTENLTQNTTTTTSTVHDIGLTGNAAVDLAKTLTGGASSVSTQALDSLQVVNQQAGNSFNQLVGGAGLLTKTAGTVAGKILDQGAAAGQAYSSQGTDIAKTIAGQGSAAGQSFSATGAQAGQNFAAQGAGVANTEIKSLSTLFSPINQALQTLTQSSQQLNANAKALGANALTTGASIANTALQGAQPQSQNSNIIMYAALAVVAIAFISSGFMRGRG